MDYMCWQNWPNEAIDQFSDLPNLAIAACSNEAGICVYMIPESLLK